METSPEPPTKRGRAFIFGGISTACLIVLLLVGLWARGSFDDSGHHLTTTTNPFAHIDRNQSVDDVAATPTTEASATATEALPAPEDWAYWTSFDEVRRDTIYRASLTSENSVSFGFPYEGGSSLTLMVRKHPTYGNDVIFKISTGQFVCGTDSCSGTINYGAGPEVIALSESTDNSSDTLFASDGDEVIKRLTATKKVIVELPFYQEGNRQFTFEATAPLVWQAATAVTADTTTVDEEASDAD
jgi:hypothetical protein